MGHAKLLFSLLSLGVNLAGCSLNKSAEIVPVEVPMNYREICQENTKRWEVGKPSDAMDRGQWWAVFGDE